MPARCGRIEGKDLHFVIRIATAWRIQAFPVENKGKQLKTINHIWNPLEAALTWLLSAPCATCHARALTSSTA